MVNKTGYFYKNYKSTMSHYSADTFKCAEETVSELLEVATSSDHPGMLLGKVQSGKTRTFISTIALAFDNTFDISIVLTKNSRALIEQTAKRLNSEFSFYIEDGELEIYDVMHAPSSFSAFELDSKLVLIAKKQSDNLERLIKLFQNNSAMASKRVLIVDDEADSASIGYVKKEGLVAARTISTQISKLRSLIKSASFLQVTATPYSLYLQPTEVEVSNVLTFKPTRPAFTKLVPVPDDYVGGEIYFGELSRSEKNTIESLIHHPVDHRELELLKKLDGRSLKLENVLTSSSIEGYRTAIINFIVGGAILRINGVLGGIKPKKLRYSFLLHSEAAKDSHKWQETLTETIIEKLAQAVENDKKLFQNLTQAAYDNLSLSLHLDKKNIPNFKEVIQAVKASLLEDHITIAKVNSDDDVADLLDSTGQLKLRSPLNIFLGGQVLDRGVTLANLIGFYYGRRPKKSQQDTVLQHSRMFGYRRGELAVTRFYTSTSIRHAMSQMEDFDSSLRAAIEAGGDRAVQFIRKASDGTIVPCSPNKILIASTQTLRPNKRILPFGFQTGYRTGANGIGKIVQEIDEIVKGICKFNTEEPVLIPVNDGIALINLIEQTLQFIDEDAPIFNWDSARAALAHLSQQHKEPALRGKILFWAANDRNSSRLASEGSHATYIETPDSEKTEGRLAKKFAIDHPILFLLRQEGNEDRGWRNTPFYWPVIRAQSHAPTAIYTADTID